MMNAILRRLCCCGTEPPPPPVGCNSTSTVPQPWPDRIYTITVGGTLSPVVCSTGQGVILDCDQATIPPACTQDGLNFYYVDACCKTEAIDSGLRVTQWTLAGGFGARFEFDSSGSTSIPGVPCSRHIPVSHQEIDLAGPQCDSFSMDSVFLDSAGLMWCSKDFLNCDVEPPTRGTRCDDVSEIQFTFIQLLEQKRQVQASLNCDAGLQDLCDTQGVAFTAIYRKQKVASDTHVALGTYDLAWLSERPLFQCAPGSKCAENLGCGIGSQYGVPSTITVGVKP